MNPGTKKKSTDILIFINTAIKNFRLYPSVSTIVVSSIDRVYHMLRQILETEEDLVIAESEKTLLFCGEPLTYKEHEKIHVISLLDILLNFGIRSITFKKRIRKEELAILLGSLSKSPDEIREEGGFHKIIETGNLSNIILDEKKYIAADKNKQFVSIIDFTDEQILQFLTQAHPNLLVEEKELVELAKNPEWLLKSFDYGLSHALDAREEMSKTKLAENISNMMVVLDKISKPLEGKDQEAVIKGVGKALSVVEADIIEQLTTQNIDYLFNGMLLKLLSNDFAQAQPAGASRSEKDGFGVDADRKASSGSDVSLVLGRRLDALLKDDKTTVVDESVTAAVPKIIDKLLARHKQESLDSIINRLLEELFDSNLVLRNKAAESLVDIIESFSGKAKLDLIEKLSSKLLDWIRFEESATHAYQKICCYLQMIVEEFMSGERFTDTINTLNVFNDIRTGELEKNDTIHEIAADFIRGLATEENLRILFNIFNSAEQDKQTQVGEVIVRLGDVAVNRLLDLLQHNTSSNERVRIMRLIIGVGKSAIPFVRERITTQAPWYYLRNMAYILGHIGNKETAYVLQPLLGHENNKLRMEALKSISRTGGNEIASLLLPVLAKADDNFKLHIVEALGSAKSAEATAQLMELLKTKPVKDKAIRSKLEEKICAALGNIGSPEAMPLLSEIVEAKSFFGIGSYPENVRLAAGNALTSIRRKQEKNR